MNSPPTCPVCERETDRRSFTLVHAIIAVLVIAALLALLIPVRREMERRQLQALVDTEPWAVFEFSARVASTGEQLDGSPTVVVHFEFVNQTDHQLFVPHTFEKLAVTISHDDMISNYPVLAPYQTSIEPRGRRSWEMDYSTPFGGVEIMDDIFVRIERLREW